MRRYLVGLIGSNIQGSLSPALHEDAFAAAGLIGHYHLMDLDLLGTRADLASLLEAARTAGFAGLNVTHPCKEAVVPLLDGLAEEARQIGAVNTVVFDRAGRAVGHNTDRSGFRRALAEALGSVAGSAVVLVGAGGAGRAVASALLDLGAGRIEVLDRLPERAAALVAAIGQPCCVAGDLGRALAAADGVVNATPVGMVGHAGSAVPAALLRPDLWVAEVVYTPLETELVLAARRRGCRVLTGDRMCVHQAADAFHLFTGLAPDRERMQRLFDRLCAARDGARAAS